MHPLRSAAALLVASAALAAPPAQAQVYRWTDAQGTVHYTDDPDTIPASKRAHAREGAPADGDHVKVESPPPGRGAGDLERARQQRKAAEAAREASWRQRFRAARERIASLEQAIAADRALVADPKALPVNRQVHGGVLPSAEYEAAVERLKRAERDLAQAREDLADLERQAAREAVPFEWRR